MTRASTAWINAARALVVLLAALNAYRAATQSITADEAFTYNHFAAAPLHEAVRFYDANNHVLNSALIRLSTALFGLSEFTVRLPSLLGGALYLMLALRLSRLLFGGGPAVLFSVALLGLNPFVLDYLSAARGYGMALAFLLAALDQMVRYLMDGGRPRLYRAALALALAVAANLAFAVPGAALALAFTLAVYAAERRADWMLVDHFLVPGAVTAFVLLVIPLSATERSRYYYGAATLAESIDSLVSASFGTSRAGSLFYFLAAGLVAAGVAAAAAALRGRLRKAPFGPLDAFLLLGGGCIGGSVAALAAAHRLAGVPYPLDRTGIYFAALFALVALALAERYGSAARVPVWTAAVLALAQFLLLLRVDHYEPWLFDAGTSRVVRELRAREDGSRRVRVSASWTLEPSLNFYRRMYRLEWLEPVVRGNAAAPADYRVFEAADHALVQKFGLTVLYRDPVSGAVLAK